MIWNKGKKNIFSNSLFRRTIMMQFGVALATLAAMFIFMNYIVVNNQKERLCDLNSSQLWRVAQDVDTRLENIQDSSTQILFSEDAIALMMNPSERSSDLGYRVISSLQRMAEENSLISKAMIYIPTTNEIYSSAGNYLGLESSTEKKAVEKYLSVREEGRSGNDMVTFRIISVEETLFLAGDLCTPQFVGAMIVKLDSNKISSLMTGNNESVKDAFFLFDASGRKVFVADHIADSARSAILNGDYYDVLNQNGKSDAGYYVYHSDITDLYYGLAVQLGEQKMSFLRILLLFLPFILIYSIFTAIYSRWLSDQIYEPINRLMRYTLTRREDTVNIQENKYRSEIEYLEEAFRDTWGENLQNRELLANISQDMQEQLFRNILIGKNVNRDYINNTMKGLGLESYLNGRYQVIVGRIQVNADREMTSMELGMYRRSLLSFLAEKIYENAVSMEFFMDTSEFVIIMAFHDEVSALQIREITGKLLEELNAFVEKLPYSLLIASGNVCNEVDSVRQSYQEAYSKVEYLSYVSEEEVSPADEPKDYDRQYFMERGQKVVEAAEKERESVAGDMVTTMIQELTAFPRDQAKKYAEILVDILLEKMIAVHVDSSEINTIHSRLERTLLDYQSDDWYTSLSDMLMSAVHSIHCSSRRSRYRYVDSAKEYISVHYSDGTLSLNEVSEAVGISAPYLSGIFSESEKMGFSAYLNNYRVDQAKQFLQQTTTNMTDIGYKCGFNSAQSFNRVFKKITGFTPGQYRDYIKNQPQSKEES